MIPSSKIVSGSPIINYMSIINDKLQCPEYNIFFTKEKQLATKCIDQKEILIEKWLYRRVRELL